MTTENTNETAGPKGAYIRTVNGVGTVSTQLVSQSTYQKSYGRLRIYERRHKPAGWLFPRAYTHSVDIKDNGYGHWWMEKQTPTNDYTKTVRQDYVGVITEYTQPFALASLSPAPSNLKSRAEIKALLKLKDQDVNFAQAFAERQMTANLLGDSLARIAKSVRQLRRGKLKQAWRTIGGDPKTLPQSWLEYQYGWTPLLSDVFNSAKLLQTKDEKSNWGVTVRGTAIEKSKADTITPGMYAHTVHLSKMWSCKVRLDYTPGDDMLRLLAQLGFTNPALLAWELLPYSFVIDWGISVGDWLSSLDAAVGWEFLSGSASYKGENLVTVSAIGGTHPNSDYRVYNSGYHARRRHMWMERQVYSSSPLPSFPGVKSPLSLVHTANGLSLLTQALKGGPPRAF